MSNIKITFNDGNHKEFEKGITGLEVAKSISKSLAKDAILMKKDHQLVDLSTSLENDCSIEIFTSKDNESLEVIRHTGAHILAEAVKELYPDVQVTIGPVIEDGFYYDFVKDEAFSTEDLAKIERQMYRIIKRNETIKREVWKRDDAIEFFKKIGEDYKAEIISDIPEGEDISLYRQGEFIDLCRGPHAPATSKVKAVKLMKVSGAYWRGDSKNKMLQRIYGTAWFDEESLKQYLYKIEEAEKRDHRKLGKELDLFHIQEEAVGQVFWHDKGWLIYRLIEDYIRNKLNKVGYKEIKTPMLLDKKLWEQSGHWDKFRENMFVSMSDEERILAIKPMNCPGHIQIFKKSIRSYRDLPLKLAEFGCCHRNEASGALHGLMRVRGFNQDDAHIFCTPEQITSETIAFCKLLQEVYNDFGFYNIKLKFSDRPEKKAGSDEIWDKAEKSLLEAVNATGIEYSLNKGEGAFYGPKLEFVLTDAIGRDWQCGTLQVDFVMPERLGANYIGSDGNKHIPVMLHRAILGSMERFIGILIEEYAGKFPLWLAPVQVVVTTVTNKVDDYAIQIYNKLQEHNIRAILDNSSDKISYKIRHHSNNKIPIIIIIGEEEKENNHVTIRRLSINEKETLEFSQIIDMIKKYSTIGNNSFYKK